MKEPTEFNLDDIVGYYGKTKAMEHNWYLMQ